MLTHYLKTAFRHLISHGLYSFINIAGLAIGLSCCVLIALYVRFELSYESNFENADKVYRISREYFPVEGARLRVPASINGPAAQALMDDFAEIEVAGRIFGGQNSLQVGDVILEEEAVRYTDKEILEVFDFKWIAGDSATALSQPDSIVLTESLAIKYFATVDVLGESISFPEAFEMKVTGVIEDIPANSHLSLTGMISMSTLSKMMGEDNYQNQFARNWGSNTDFFTYFKLMDGAQVSSVEAGIPAFMDRHIAENASGFGTLPIMNIRDIHLNSDRDEEWLPSGNRANVLSFTAVALGILLIACINFMSIATARSSQRSKEVGARLAMGATRTELIFQFLGESAITAVIAMFLAIGLVELLLPVFASFIGIQSLSFNILTDGDLLLVLMLLTGFVAFFSGSYPAFYLSGFRAVTVLKGEMGIGKKSLWLRNAMVILQFSIAIALVVSTSVIYLQRQHAVNIDLGFEKDAIVVLPSAVSGAGYREDWPTLKTELLAHSAIESVTVSHFLPFGFNDNQLPIRLRGSTEDTRIQYMVVEYDFFETYQMSVLAGRGFSADFAGDALLMPSEDAFGKATSVLNQSAAATLGFQPDEYAEQNIEVLQGEQVILTGEVAGIVADTYFESIRRDVRPIAFILALPESQGIARLRDASIRINPQRIDEALAHIDSVWSELYPGLTNSRYFLDDDFRAMYELENRAGNLLTMFSVLALLIACFGLFGLASFNAERRTKEIGVRKVVGSSVWRIVLLLSNDFSKLVLLANLIAWPMAWIAMNRWLENFAYRIDLSPLIFIGSGLIALCIAWVTVGSTAAKAASQKPILALRYE